MKTLEEAGRMLMEKRLSTGKSVKELSNLSGVKINTIYNWEKKGFLPPREATTRYLELLGVDASSFYVEVNRIKEGRNL